MGVNQQTQLGQHKQTSHHGSDAVRQSQAAADSDDALQRLADGAVLHGVSDGAANDAWRSVFSGRWGFGVGEHVRFKVEHHDILRWAMELTKLVSKWLISLG